MIICICQIMQCVMFFILSSQIRQSGPYTSCRCLSAASLWFCRLTAQCHLHTFHSPVLSVSPLCNNLFIGVMKIKFYACLSIFSLDTRMYVSFVLPFVTSFPLSHLSLTLILPLLLPPSCFPFLPPFCDSPSVWIQDSIFKDWTNKTCFRAWV